MVGGPKRLNQLREHAREIASSLGYDAQFKRLNNLIGALLGTHESKILTAKQALARAAGHPYDPHRLEIFDALFTALNLAALERIEDPAPAGVAREDFAFFEAYFRLLMSCAETTMGIGVFHGLPRQTIQWQSEFDSDSVLERFCAA
jgi:hypothetical protein